MTQPNRRADLDGLRGVAIVLTLFLHYVSRSEFFPVYHAPWPIANLLDSFWSGVDIFFVLSGFLIGGIIIDNRNAVNFFRLFYLRRALRIFPLAFLAILLAYLAMPALGAGFPNDRQVPPLAYLLFINNLWTASGVSAYPPLGPMWSLSIEEQFYLIAPAFILLVSHRRWLTALIIIVLASPWIRLFSPWLSVWDFTLYRLDGLSLGMLVAILLREQAFLNYAAANQWSIKAITFGMVAITLLFSMSPEFSTRERIAFGISLNSFAAAGVIVYLHFNRDSGFSRALSRTWLVVLGRWSYFLYLMHMPILFCVAALGLPHSLRPVAALAICLLGARISWHYFEKPLIDYGRRVGYRQSPARLTAQGPFGNGRPG
jgi:peptidoglycan/LPS O-acetylase OafA/YrhL